MYPPLLDKTLHCFLIINGIRVFEPMPLYATQQMSHDRLWVPYCHIFQTFPF
jgi:hypothetical protein